MAIGRPQPAASYEQTTSNAPAARSISKEEREATIKLAQASIRDEEEGTSAGTSGDPDSDSDMSGSTLENAESAPIPIRIPFPPKQRGKYPRTRGTRTKLVVFHTQDTQRHHKELRRIKKEHPSARLDRDGETTVISVITSCLTPEQLLRIEEEKEACRLAQESAKDSAQIALFKYVQERQLEDFREGKCDPGTIEFEEEMKTWSQEQLDQYEEKGRADVVDLRIALFELQYRRSRGKKWRLRKCVEVDMEDSVFGKDFAVQSSEETYL